MSDQQSGSQRRARGGRLRRWLVRLAWAVGVLALLLAVAVLALRDLPRRLLERVLSARLDAVVTVERLELGRPIELEGVRIRSMRTLPALEALSAPRVVVRGRWRSLLRGEVESLDVPEGRAVLEPACGTPLELPEPRGRLARLELGVLEIEVRDGDRRAVAEVSGVLERAAGGGGLAGVLEIDADRADLGPLVALWRPETARRCGAEEPPVALRVEDAEGELTLGPAPAGTGLSGLSGLSGASGAPGGGTAVGARLAAARAVVSRAGAEVVLRSSRLETSLRPPGERDGAVEATLSAEGLRRGRIELVLAASAVGEGSLGAWRAEIEGLELAPLLPLVSPLGPGQTLEGEGLVDARIEGPASGPWPFRVEARVERLVARGDVGAFTVAELTAELTGATVELAGEVAPEALRRDGPEPGVEAGRAVGRVRAEARLERVVVDGIDALEGRLPGVELGGVVVDASTEIRTAADSTAGVALPDRWIARGLELRAEIGEVRAREAELGTAGDLSWIAPVRAVLRGDASRRSLTGSARLDGAGLGEWTAGGQIELPTERGAGGLALDWSFAGEELAVLAERWRELGGAWPEGLAVGGVVSARGSLRGTPADPVVRARLAIADPVLEASVRPAGTGVGGESAEPVAVAAAAAALELQVEGSRAGGLEVRTAEPVRAAVTIDGGAAEEVTAAASGAWHPEGFALERLELDAGELGRLEARDARLQDAGEGWRAEGSLSFEGARLPAWLRRLAPDGSQWADAAESVAGVLGGELELRAPAGEDWRLTGTLALAGGGWSSADGSRVVQGFEPRFALAAGPASRGLEVVLGGEVGGFQALWDALFFDYTSRFVDLEATVRWGGAEGVAGSGEAAGGGPLEVALELTGEGVEVLARLTPGAGEDPWQGLVASARLEVIDLERAWRAWVREPVAGSGALAERVGLAGRARLELEAERRDGEWRVGGETLVAGASVAVGEDSELSGLGISLPVELTVSSTADGRLQISGPERVGTLRFTRLRVGDVEVAPVDAALSLRGDRVALRDALAVPLFSGLVELDALALEGALAGDPAFAADVRVAALDLREATEAFGLFPLEGRVDARFPRVTVTEDGRLETDVEGAVEIFGGRVEVTELSGSELFGSFPRLRMSARLHELDLAELTRTLEFGEITGFVRGEVEDLELVGGTPVRFHGWVGSVPDRREKRRVSIRAVNNIARLGTGSDIGALQRGIRKLFDSYPYVSLGMALALQRDDFLLRGLERRGDKELFLKGRWPLRLDIVNVKPGTRVSFSTMMRRIGNLEIQRGAPPPADR